MNSLMARYKRIGPGESRALCACAGVGKKARGNCGGLGGFVAEEVTASTAMLVMQDVPVDGTTEA